jgi:hypothetical protein
MATFQFPISGNKDWPELDPQIEDPTTFMTDNSHLPAWHRLIYDELTLTWVPKPFWGGRLFHSAVNNHSLNIAVTPGDAVHESNA